MKTNNYETPSMAESELCLEGVLCSSLEGFGNENESYGGVPGEDDSIF